MPDPLDILELAEDGGEGGRISWGSVHRCLGSDAGDPIYPAIFNVVVYAVVQHWVSVMVEVAEEQDGHGQEGRNQNYLFCVDNGMIASSDPLWLQGDFSTLVGLFNRVGLKTNVGKTVEMVYHPCQAAGTPLEAAYGRRMTGEGPLYRESQRGQSQCKECME